MRVADVIADGLRRARVARVFVADGADPVLVGAVRDTGLAIVQVRAAASACAMAAVTGTLADVPGAAILGEASDAAARAADVAAALASATRDCASVVVIASWRPTGVDIKTAVEVDAASVGDAIVQALQAAVSERPGPAWLTVNPESSATSAGPRCVDIAARIDTPMVTRPAVDTRQVQAVVDRLAACERPLIVAGRECRAPGAATWLRAFAEALPAPVLVTPAARGALPDPHPLSLGLVRPDSPVLARADLVVTLGIDRIELDRAGVTLAGPVVHMGRAAGDACGTTVHAAGDIAALLEELAFRLGGRIRADWDVAELDRLRRATPLPATDPNLAVLVTRVREATTAGTAAVFSRALEPLTPRWQAVAPGELVVADAALPAAIAVALARPESATILFARGDEVAVSDLAVAVAAQVRLVAIVVDGRVDGAVVGATGVRLVRPLSLPALAVALGDVASPTVIALPRAE